MHPLQKCGKQLLIKDAAKIHGTLSHKTLKENLPEDISYSEIRLVMAALNRNSQNPHNSL